MATRRAGTNNVPPSGNFASGSSGVPLVSTFKFGKAGQ